MAVRRFEDEVVGLKMDHIATPETFAIDWVRIDPASSLSNSALDAVRRRNGKSLAQVNPNTNNTLGKRRKHVD